MTKNEKLDLNDLMLNKIEFKENSLENMESLYVYAKENGLRMSIAGFTSESIRYDDFSTVDTYTVFISERGLGLKNNTIEKTFKIEKSQKEIKEELGKNVSWKKMAEINIGSSKEIFNEIKNSIDNFEYQREKDNRWEKLNRI